MVDYRLKAAPIEIKVKAGILELIADAAKHAGARVVFNFRRLIGSRTR